MQPGRPALMLLPSTLAVLSARDGAGQFISCRLQCEPSGVSPQEAQNVAHRPEEVKQRWACCNLTIISLYERHRIFVKRTLRQNTLNI